MSLSSTPINPAPPICPWCGEAVGDNEYDVESGGYFSSHSRCSHPNPDGLFGVVTVRNGIREHETVLGAWRFLHEARALAKARDLAQSNLYTNQGHKSLGFAVVRVGEEYKYLTYVTARGYVTPQSFRWKRESLQGGGLRWIVSRRWEGSPNTPDTLLAIIVVLPGTGAAIYYPNGEIQKCGRTFVAAMLSQYHGKGVFRKAPAMLGGES